MALRELASFYCHLVQQLNLLGPRMTAVAIVTDFTKGRGSSSIQIQVGLFRLLLLPCELVVPCYRFHPVERSCSLVITTGCRAGQSETRERVVKKGKARSTQCRHAKPYYPGPTFGMARLDESENELLLNRPLAPAASAPSLTAMHSMRALRRMLPAGSG